MISAGAVRTAAFYCVCFSALPVPFFIFGKAGEDDPAAEEGGEAPEEGIVDAGLGSLVDGSRVIGIRGVRRGGLGGVFRAGSGGVAGPIGDGHGGQAHEADADAAFFRGVGEDFNLAGTAAGGDHVGNDEGEGLIGSFGVGEEDFHAFRGEVSGRDPGDGAVGVFDPEGDV